MNDMFALASTTTFAQEIKRSRFLAVAGPVSYVQAAKNFITANSSAEANHNCWAWRIGQDYRFSDDGEPSGTAGKPILLAIDGQELDGVAVVVTRWFGGVLLGSGGLIRAYGGTAALCLQAAEKTKIVATISTSIDIQFSDLALVKARLNALAEVSIDGEHYTASGAILDLRIAAVAADTVIRTVTDLTSGRAVVKSEP